MVFGLLITVSICLLYTRLMSCQKHSFRCTAMGDGALSERRLQAGFDGLKVTMQTWSAGIQTAPTRGNGDPETLERNCTPHMRIQLQAEPSTFRRLTWLCRSPRLSSPFLDTLAVVHISLFYSRTSCNFCSNSFLAGAMPTTGAPVAGGNATGDSVCVAMASPCVLYE